MPKKSPTVRWAIKHVIKVSEGHYSPDMAKLIPKSMYDINLDKTDVFALALRIDRIRFRLERKKAPQKQIKFLFNVAATVLHA